MGDLVDDQLRALPVGGGARSHVVLAEKLRRRVELRLLLPGDALPPERELMRIFSAGRETVQQALALLARDGLVIKRRGRSGGAFVTDAIEHQEHLELALARVTAASSQIREALAYRLQIEPTIVAEACRQRGADDLEAISEAQRGLTVAETATLFMHHDGEFHRAIAVAAHNRYLLKAAEDIRMALSDAQWVAGGANTWLGRTVAEHDSILAAIESRNGEAGHRAAVAHVQHSVKTISELLAEL